MNSISRNTHLFNDFINSIYLNRDFIKVLDKYEYDLDGMDIYLWGVEKVNNDFKFTKKSSRKPTTSAVGMKAY